MYRCHSSHVLCGTIKGRFWIITLCYTVFCRHYIVVVVIIPILILDLLWVECCYYFCHCLHFVTKHTERFPFYKFILIFNLLTNFNKWRTLSIWGNLLFFFIYYTDIDTHKLIYDNNWVKYIISYQWIGQKTYYPTNNT